MGGDRVSPIVRLIPAVFPTCIKMLKTKMPDVYDTVFLLSTELAIKCCIQEKWPIYKQGENLKNAPEVVNAVCAGHLTNTCRLKLLEADSQTLRSFCVDSRPHKAGVKPAFRPGSAHIHTAQLWMSTDTSSKHCLIPAQLSVQRATLRLESCKSHQLYCLKTQCLSNCFNKIYS